MENHIESSCDGCGVRLRVAAKFAGRQARCPGCDHVYTVPAPSTAISHKSIAETTETFDHQPKDVERSHSPTSDSTWFLKTPDGRNYGPVDKLSLDQWVRDGRVNHACRIKKSENASWQSADEIYSSLTDERQADTDSAALTKKPDPSSFKEPHRGGLILSFGVLSFLMPCLIFGIVAWIMGSNDLNKMDLGVMNPEGRGLTQAGKILGIVSIVVSAIALLAAFLFFLLLLSFRF